MHSHTLLYKHNGTQHKMLKSQLHSYFLLAPIALHPSLAPQLTSDEQT